MKWLWGCLVGVLLGLPLGAFGQTAGWEFPASASYSASSSDNGKILGSDNAPGATITISLPNPATVGAGWLMGFSEGNGRGLVLNAPGGVYILAGLKSNTSLTVPSNTNYEFLTLQSDGTNFRLLSATSKTTWANGFTPTPGPGWTYLFASGYGSTVGDNGAIFNNSTAGGATTVTLPSTPLIPNGWQVDIFPSGNSMTVNLNNTQGGTLYSPSGAVITNYVAAAGSGQRRISFDGAGFHISPGSLAAQETNNIAVTGGAISGVAFSGGSITNTPTLLPVNKQNTGSYNPVSSDCGTIILFTGNVFGTENVGSLTNYAPSCQMTLRNGDAYPSGRGRLVTVTGGLPFSSFMLWPGQEVTLTADTSAWHVGNVGRWRLPAGLQLYVNPSTGNDTNDCLALTAPCQHIQAAIGIVQNQVDFTTGLAENATINLATGSDSAPVVYNEALTFFGPLVGSEDFTILGNPSDQGSVIIAAPDCTGGNQPPACGYTIQARDQGIVTLNGVTLETHGANYYLIYSSQFATVDVENTTFGALVSPTAAGDMFADELGTINITGAVSFAGSVQDIMAAEGGAQIITGPGPATVLTGMSVTQAVANALFGGRIDTNLAWVNPGLINGAGVGSLAEYNAVVQRNGTVLPLGNTVNAQFGGQIQ